MSSCRQETPENETREVEPRNGPGRGHPGEIPDGTRIKWTITDVIKQDGENRIVCPECHAISQDRTALRIINDPMGIPPKGGQHYCWNCRRNWQRATLGQPALPRRVGSQKRSQTRTERAQYEFEKAQQHEERNRDEPVHASY